MERHLVVLTSDHGLTPTHTHLDIGDWLTARGLKAVYYPVIWKTDPKSAVMISGNSFGSIHLLNHEGDHVLRQKDILLHMGSQRLEELVQEPAIDFIVYRGKEEDSFVVHNAAGISVIRAGNGHFGYLPITSDPFGLPQGIHVQGHRAALEASFENEYPDFLYQIYQLFQSRRAGDIVISAKVGYDLRDFWEFPEHKGSHGSLHRSHMHVPLIYNRKNWKTHPARTADLFDTILKWKGIRPDSSEGDPLF